MTQMNKMIKLDEKQCFLDDQTQKLKNDPTPLVLPIADDADKQNDPESKTENTTLVMVKIQKSRNDPIYIRYFDT